MRPPCQKSGECRSSASPPHYTPVQNHQEMSHVTKCCVFSSRGARLQPKNLACVRHRRMVTRALLRGKNAKTVTAER